MNESQKFKDRSRFRTELAVVIVLVWKYYLKNVIVAWPYPQNRTTKTLVKTHSSKWVSLLTITLLAPISNLLTSIPRGKRRNSQENIGYIVKSRLWNNLSDEC